MWGEPIDWAPPDKPALLESGLNCLKTGLLTPGSSKLCLEVSLYLPRVLPSPGVRSLPLIVTMEAPQLRLDAVHSVTLEVQDTGHTPHIARESNVMRSLMGVRETERPLQTVEGWLVASVSTLLVSAHSGQMSGWYGFVYVKFPFRLWAGWVLVLSRRVLLAKVDRCHPCLLTAQLPYLLMVSVGREDPGVFGVGTPTLWCKLGMGTMPLALTLL